MAGLKRHFLFSFFKRIPVFVFFLNLPHLFTRIIYLRRKEKLLAFEKKISVVLGVEKHFSEEGTSSGCHITTPVIVWDHRNSSIDLSQAKILCLTASFLVGFQSLKVHLREIVFHSLSGKSVGHHRYVCPLLEPARLECDETPCGEFLFWGALREIC